MASTPTPSGRSPWKRVLWLALAVAVIVCAYLGWGMWLEGRYNETVAALAERGVVRWKDRVAEPVLDAENGAPLVAEAAELFREVEEEVTEAEREKRDDLGPYLLLGHDPSSEVGRSLWNAARPRLEPCMRLIERAVEFPVISPGPTRDPGDLGPSGGVISLAELVRTYADFDPAESARSLTLLFGMLRRLRDDEIAVPATFQHCLVRAHALELLEETMARGHDLPAEARADWLSVLDAWDARAEALAEYRLSVATALWWMEERRTGRAGTAWERFAWWLARPMMLRRTTATFESVFDALDAEWSEKSIRDHLRNGSERGDLARRLAWSLARARLARLALRIAAHRDATGDWPGTLQALRLPTGTDALTDPYSGKVFPFASAGDHLVLSSAALDVLPELAATTEIEFGEDLKVELVPGPTGDPGERRRALRLEWRFPLR